jgi:hypothetical protein
LQRGLKKKKKKERKQSPNRSACPQIDMGLVQGMAEQVGALSF